MSLAGKHALVTGGTRGIGLSVTRALAECGVRVTAVSRTPLPVKIAAANAVEVLAADVNDPDIIEQILQLAESRSGPVEILVNNAGQARSAPFLKTDRQLWRQMLSTNLEGTVNCTRAALPGMLAGKWGRIVNIASTAGLSGYAYVSAYCAAKHAVVGLTRALAFELATTGVTVNAVCPGFTDTEMTQRTIENIVKQTGRAPEQAAAALTVHNPQKRLVRPEEVASAVLWLCQAESASLNGQVIPVAGGEKL